MEKRKHTLAISAGSAWKALTFVSYVSMPLSQTGDMGFGAYDSAALSQTLAGATAGQVYFFTAQLNLPGMTSQGYCDVYFSAGSEPKFQLQLRHECTIRLGLCQRNL